MYVDDIDSLEELFDLEREAQDRVWRLSQSLTGSQSPDLEQAGWDLEDIRGRIKELGA